MSDYLYLNATLLCISFCLVMVLFYNLSDLKHKVAQLNYYVYKPLFPYEVAAEDPLHIDVHDNA